MKNRMPAGARPFAATLLALSLIGGASSAFAQAQQATPEMKAKAKEVARACRTDIRQFCKGIEPGGGRIAICLQEHAASVSPTCQQTLAGALGQ
ncbi:cysteine rich repeat-containing protein [Rhizobium sp. TRM95111]|uniref:cysteine rich repeat-containing protein n=1 Tax=Rhizobium alarense TaxID=2846851 RepID=UPI001F26FD09|nr:cysteine rich repeat-containing protein [Rhizobium alarense]MCF3641286.1 cysteine rich repeat-containing protein [Rhizobium alarense]